MARSIHFVSIEMAYRNESEACRERRRFIEAGEQVSLLAYDPSRDLYVFNVY